ncbi:hypothetical protein [Paraclostridium sordellii]|uniref:hypothetical protein n=1 Tax=Paraclostridium sordellii TaxID=1505 RepID=UPI0005DF6B09|nr:hypothetical protein [Paeniclostridium sordellii]CEO27951.1 Uncharacterised protein [[Clostridium] sordellii] [Paeniclostridium sordellii]
MIRHITSEDNYNQIIECGYLTFVDKGYNRTRRERNTVSFEVYSNNNNFIGIASNRPEYKDKKLVAIYIDENKLIEGGFKVHFTSSITYEERTKNGYTSKYENIIYFGANENNRFYQEIGEYVHIEGNIPISYFEKIERFEFIEAETIFRNITSF